MSIDDTEIAALAEVLRTAEAVLEARKNQLPTSKQWSALRHAIAALTPEERDELMHAVAAVRRQASRSR